MHLVAQKFITFVFLVPGEVGNLVCAANSSPSELSFSWDLPTLLGGEVISYQVIMNRLEHRSGTRESAVDEKFVKSLDARVTGLGMNEYNYRRVL